MGRMTSHILWKINMFQTTNQYIYIYNYIYIYIYINYIPRTLGEIFFGWCHAAMIACSCLRHALQQECHQITKVGPVARFRPCIKLENYTTKTFWSFASVLFCLVGSSETRRFTNCHIDELDEN